VGSDTLDGFVVKVLTGLAHGKKMDGKAEFFQKEYFIGYESFRNARIPF
jgi:hypothetical protein